MTDRELLELAALAAGVDYQLDDAGQTIEYFGGGLQLPFDDGKWNPLTDDGDALRLAVRLNIPVYPYDDETSTGTIGVVAKNWGSKEANTRRAIVMAAAEIGRAMRLTA